jgi:hypothetical protein
MFLHRHGRHKPIEDTRHEAGGRHAHRRYRLPPFVGVDYKSIESNKPVPVGKGMLKFRPFHNTNGLHAERLTERIGRIARGKQLFTELQEKYGIAVVPTSFVVGNESGPLQEEGYYRYAPKIVGRQLMEELRDPESKLTNETVDATYAGIGKYYRDKLGSGEPFVLDMSNRQLMYGHLAHKTEDKIWMVDVEPFYTTQIGLGQDGNPDVTLIGQACAFEDMITGAEWARQAYLPQARSAAAALFTAIDPATPGYGEYIGPRLAQYSFEQAS